MAIEEKRGTGRSGAAGGAGKPAGQAGGTQATKRQDRRPEVVRQRREERLRYHERARKRRQYQRIGLAAAAVVVLVGAVWGVWRWNESRVADISEFDVRSFDGANVETGHVDGVVAYGVTPPVGGQHNAVWQNCGFYDQPVNNENGVHSMEHGAVWITYRPDLPADQIATLREKADRSYILVSPYPDLPAPVVLSSWGKQLTVDSADDDGVDSFIEEYRASRDVPEPGARCDGGTSVTRQ